MVIIQKRVGQLGNQLFAIAHFAAAAIENDYRVLFPCFEYPLEQFPNINTSPNLRVFRFGPAMNRLVHGFFKLLRLTVPDSPWHQCYVAEGSPFVNVGSAEFAADAQKKIVACEGFGFRDGESVIKYRRVITELFQPSEATERKVQEFIADKRLNQNFVVVGFHVRRLDYRTYRNGEYYFDDVVWASWIRQAREVFRSDEKRFIGIIFSDEDVAGLVNSANDLIRGPGGIYEDLCMLSKCDYIIGPPSTFSGWASFIGRVPLLRMTTPDMQVTPSLIQVVNW
jgi:glycosyl transferase family 11